MPTVARGGTDGATMVLFWPDNLPDNADQVLQDDPIALIESLDAEGKLIWLPCDGDGSYTLAVYVGEDLPPDLAAVCNEHEQYPRVVASGDAFFGGGEYVFKRDDTLLSKYPHMAGRFTLPAGTYAAAVYTDAVPDGLYPRWLRDRVGAAAKRTHDIFRALAALSVLAVLAAVAGLFLLPWVGKVAAPGAAAVLVTATVLASRTAGHKAVRAAAEEFEGMYPDYVVRLAGVAGE